jgi:hypothetical protein
MDVRIDHPWDQRAPAGINGAGQRIEAARAVRRPGVHDAAVLCDENRVVYRIQAAPVEQPRAANHKGVSHRASIFPAMVAPGKRASPYEGLSAVGDRGFEPR